MLRKNRRESWPSSLTGVVRGRSMPGDQEREKTFAQKAAPRHSACRDTNQCLQNVLYWSNTFVFMLIDCFIALLFFVLLTPPSSFILLFLWKPDSFWGRRNYFLQKHQYSLQLKNVSNASAWVSKSPEVVWPLDRWKEPGNLTDSCKDTLLIPGTPPRISGFCLKRLGVVVWTCAQNPKGAQNEVYERDQFLHHKDPFLPTSLPFFCL